jgi:N-acetylmuramoyl-L-alanine amidase
LKVCIDAGHGLGNKSPGVYDPGAVYGQQEEASLVLIYASLLNRELIHRGHVTVLTRPSYESVAPLGARQTKATGCDVFVSLHCNASTNTTPSGTEVWYLIDSKLAMSVCNSICEALKTKNRWAKRSQTLAVLKSSIPSILVEIGFMSNPQELALLADQQSPAKVAQAIATALEAWKK